MRIIGQCRQADIDKITNTSRRPTLYCYHPTHVSPTSWTNEYLFTTKCLAT